MCLISPNGIVCHEMGDKTRTIFDEVIKAMARVQFIIVRLCRNVEESFARVPIAAV